MSESDEARTTRRRFLVAGAAVAAGAAIAPAAASAITRRRARLWARPDLLGPSAGQAAALAVLGRSALRAPGSLPDPSLPAGTDTIPQIEHIVVLMNGEPLLRQLLGMLGRGPYQLAAATASRSRPTATRPTATPRAAAASSGPS